MFTLMAGSGKYLPRLEKKYEFIRDRYYNPLNKGWSFYIGENGKEDDTHLDLYAHSFLILAFSQYAKAANNPEALILASKTALLIDTKFRHAKHPGFYEGLNADLSPVDKLRRQNPHMHLLEACLFAYDATREDIYAKLAHEIYDLFKNYFFDEATGTLTEFFTDDLRPHETEGDKIEAGHHFEWVWLP